MLLTAVWRRVSFTVGGSFSLSSEILSKWPKLLIEMEHKLLSSPSKVIILNSISDILGESSSLRGSFGGCPHMFYELSPD